MKRITILLNLLLCVSVLFAQAPEKFTYQAVIRNANNSLISNAPVGVRVSILQGTASGSRRSHYLPVGEGYGERQREGSGGGG